MSVVEIYYSRNFKNATCQVVLKAFENQKFWLKEVVLPLDFHNENVLFESILQACQLNPQYKVKTTHITIATANNDI